MNMWKNQSLVRDQAQNRREGKRKNNKTDQRARTWSHEPIFEECMPPPSGAGNGLSVSTDEEAQKGEVTGPRSHSWEWPRLFCKSLSLSFQ